MPQFDQEKMVKLVSELRKSLTRLKDLSTLSSAEFVDDPDKVGSAKYHLIVCIEACIDMCNHIISRNGLRVPEDYSDTFRVMGENKIIPEKFADELVTMAKFRNRLVHIYWEVDDLQLYDIVRKRLGDFKIFLDSLSKYLKWQNYL